MAAGERQRRDALRAHVRAASRAARARNRRQAGGDRDAGLGARRWAGDRARGPLSCRGRQSEGALRPARSDARPAAGRRRHAAPAASRRRPGVAAAVARRQAAEGGRRAGRGHPACGRAGGRGDRGRARVAARREPPHRDAAVGREGLPDSGRRAHASVRPAGVHGGERARAAEDVWQLPGRREHPVVRVRRAADRSRHGLEDRGALFREGGAVAGSEGDDPHAVLRDERSEQARRAAGRRADAALPEGRRARRGDDGRGHRVREREGGARRRADRYRRRGGRARQGLFAQARRQAGAARPARAGKGRCIAREDRADDRFRAARRRAARDRGGVRGSRDQGRRHAPERSGARARRAFRVEHVDAADHGARAGERAAGELHRPAFLLAGGQDAARRGDRRPRHERRSRARSTT